MSVSLVKLGYAEFWKNVLEVLESPEEVLEFFVSKRVGTLSIMSIGCRVSPTTPYKCRYTTW